MRETMKLAVRLMIFALAAALLLAVVNELTEDKIIQNTQNKINAARQSVIGDYTFEDTGADLSHAECIKGVYAAMKGDRVKGYVYEMETKGYGGTIYLSVGIVSKGTISGVTVSSHSETKGLGSKDEQYFMKDFIGLDVSSGGTGSIDAMSGATISSNAVKKAVNEAMIHFEAHYAETEGGN